MLNININNIESSKQRTKSAKVVKHHPIFSVLETNRPDVSLLLPLARHLYSVLDVQRTEDEL